MTSNIYVPNQDLSNSGWEVSGRSPSIILPHKHQRLPQGIPKLSRLHNWRQFAHASNGLVQELSRGYLCPPQTHVWDPILGLYSPSSSWPTPVETKITYFNSNNSNPFTVFGMGYFNPATRWYNGEAMFGIVGTFPYAYIHIVINSYYYAGDVQNITFVLLTQYHGQAFVAVPLSEKGFYSFAISCEKPGTSTTVNVAFYNHSRKKLYTDKIISFVIGNTIPVFGYYGPANGTIQAIGGYHTPSGNFAGFFSCGFKEEYADQHSIVELATNPFNVFAPNKKIKYFDVPTDLYSRINEEPVETPEATTTAILSNYHQQQPTQLFETVDDIESALNYGVPGYGLVQGRPVARGTLTDGWTSWTAKGVGSLAGYTGGATRYLGGLTIPSLPTARFYLAWYVNLVRGAGATLAQTLFSAYGLIGGRYTLCQIEPANTGIVLTFGHYENYTPTLSLSHTFTGDPGWGLLEAKGDGTTVSLYFNGVLLTSGIPSAWYDNIDSPILCRRAVDWTYTVSVVLAVASRKHLPDTKQFIGNPWQFFKPQRKVCHFDAYSYNSNDGNYIISDTINETCQLKLDDDTIGSTNNPHSVIVRAWRDTNGETLLNKTSLVSTTYKQQPKYPRLVDRSNPFAKNLVDFPVITNSGIVGTRGLYATVGKTLKAFYKNNLVGALHDFVSTSACHCRLLDDILPNETEVTQTIGNEGFTFYVKGSLTGLLSASSMTNFHSAKMFASVWFDDGYYDYTGFGIAQYSTNGIYFVANFNGSGLITIDLGTVNSNEVFEVFVFWYNNSISVYLNGTQVGTDTSCIIDETDIVGDAAIRVGLRSTTGYPGSKVTYALGFWTKSYRSLLPQLCAEVKNVGKIYKPNKYFLPKVYQPYPTKLEVILKESKFPDEPTIIKSTEIVPTATPTNYSIDLNSSEKLQIVDYSKLLIELTSKN